jgi:hypothetical protein
MTQTEQKKAKVKAWKVKISGSYRKAGREIIDFQDVEGYLPAIDEDRAVQLTRKRYAQMWIQKNPKFTERLETIREVHIDDMEIVTIEAFSYIGKDIAKMTMEELQDFAAANDLRSVPLYKKTSLRQMQNVAYASYARDVKRVQQKSKKPEHEREYKLLTDHRTEGFNVTKNPPIIADSKLHFNDKAKVTNEEMIEAEQESTGHPKETMTLEQLKELADIKGIPYSYNISREKLYDRLYGSGESE